MKPKIIFLSICLALVMFLAVTSGAWAADVGTAKVYGKITQADGKPAANVPVRVIVEGIDYKDFPWRVYIVPTDAQGNYSASIRFPMIPTIQFVVEVYKTDKVPFEYEFNWIKFRDNPPQDGGSYKINVKLKANPYYTNFRCRVLDSETGQPVEVGGINVFAGGRSDWFYTYSNGNCSGTIDLTQPSGVATIVSPVGTEDVLYLKHKVDLTLEAGKIHDFVLWLDRDKSASYIYGTVTDASTGQPIPYAHVVMLGPNDEREVGLTDFLGRYRHYVLNTGEFRVTTLGAHTGNADLSPYLRETKHVTVGAGMSEKVDLQMIKK